MSIPKDRIAIILIGGPHDGKPMIIPSTDDHVCVRVEIVDFIGQDAPGDYPPIKRYREAIYKQSDNVHLFKFERWADQ